MASYSAWLKEEEHPVIARVNKRIGDMTNLNQATSEELQVAFALNVAVISSATPDIFNL